MRIILYFKSIKLISTKKYIDLKEFTQLIKNNNLTLNKRVSFLSIFVN